MTCALCKQPIHGYRYVEHFEAVRYFALCEQHTAFVEANYVVKVISAQEYERAQMVSTLMES